jgi:uncharacterized protein YecE (DUF72 family)
MELWIGTSGYVYPDWIGPFYPTGTTSAEMLPFYAECFPLVELNFSYYRTPTADQLANMARLAHRDFQFIVKAHRSMTHERKKDSFDAFRKAVQPLRASRQLLNVLCQFPQRFHFNKTNQQWLTIIREQLAELPVAVEFRHHSWDRPEVADWLQDEGITLISVDVPDLPSIYPRKLVQTGRQIYVRFHSRRADRWYVAGTERYDYLYSDEELLSWLNALAQRDEETDRALLLFNNCWHANAITNARRMVDLLSETDHPFRIISPFGTDARKSSPVGLIP